MGESARGATAIVRQALRAVAMARGAEAFLLGSSAFLLALAAAVVSGVDLGTRDAWGAALITGVCAAGSWWLERRPEPGRIAIAVDRATRQDGRLLTAFESEGRSPDSPITWLLSREVRERVQPRVAVRAALPNSMPLLALPFLAAALLSTALEARPGEEADLAFVAPLARGVSAELEQARDIAVTAARAGELSQGELREVLDLDGRARELANRSRSGALDPAEVEEQMETLREDIERLARQSATSPLLAEALERAATYADGALMGIEQALAEFEPESAEGAARRSGTDEPEGAPDLDSGSRSGSGEESTDSALANREPIGTMSGQSAPGEPGEPEPQPGPGDSSPAGAVGSGPWWPQRFAGVVGRWVELQRTELDPPHAPNEELKR